MCPQILVCPTPPLNDHAESLLVPWSQARGDPVEVILILKTGHVGVCPRVYPWPLCVSPECAHSYCVSLTLWQLILEARVPDETTGPLRLEPLNWK